MATGTSGLNVARKPGRCISLPRTPTADRRGCITLPPGSPRPSGSDPSAWGRFVISFSRGISKARRGKRAWVTYLDPDTSRRLKAAAAMSDRSMQSLGVEAAELLIERYGTR